MKYIFKKILPLFFFLALPAMHSLHAQEFSPISKLAQDYIERLNDDLSATDGLIPSSGAVVVNPEAVARDAITESIDMISKTVEEMQQEKEKTINEIKEFVKQDIDTAIIQIRKTTEKPAYELQRAVDADRTELFENISQTIESINPSESEKLVALQSSINFLIDEIQLNLESESGMSVSFQRSKREIVNRLNVFKNLLEEKNAIIDSRQGTLIFEDSDADGISDYDEIYIYKTDPDNARTLNKEGMTDGQKIEAGIDPLSETDAKIAYQDPREDREAFVSSTYRVDKMHLVQKDAENSNEKIIFEGSALPNTFITLYIYSTPLVATVKTDSDGKWTYGLDSKLENGEHQMFVATVGTSGKIVIRSNPVIFTKSAEAATIGIAGNLNNSITTQNFLKDNFILITLAILISIVVMGMMFVGNHKNIRSAVSELKSEVSSKY